MLCIYSNIADAATGAYTCTCTKKKTIPITIGAIMDPKIIPNLNHSLFSGVNSFEFINPKIKKTEEIIADQILAGSSFVKGQMLTIKKTMKKTKPKFLFELIFILFI